jgi:hypothetical protein
MRHFFLVVYLFLSVCAFASDGFVYLANKEKLFFVSGNDILSPDKSQVLYFNKGNIFFSGTSDDRQNIFLLTTSMNTATNKTAYLYEKDSRQATYCFVDNQFFVFQQSQSEENEAQKLLYITESGKWLAFYSAYNDSLLAYFEKDSLPAFVKIITAYTLIEKYDLINKKSVQWQESTTNAEQHGFSSIKPIWGNVSAGEWIWDGQVLRPRWNADPRLAWTFDGQTIKPYLGNNIYAQYSWDGEYFKPVWRNNRQLEWSWDGRILKPVWDTDWANQYMIQNGVIKPWSNVHTEREWQMDGEIPLPLIILVISGLALKY